MDKLSFGKEIEMASKLNPNAAPFVPSFISNAATFSGVGSTTDVLNADEFPGNNVYGGVGDEGGIAAPDFVFHEHTARVTDDKSWAEIAAAGVPATDSSEPVMMSICPFEVPCPYGNFCVYPVHLELCKMCDQYCLDPTDLEQRRKHNQECLHQHEQAMELSFAVARSKDKTCGICFDTIMEKAGREKRFGILPNCSHIFCLECIRKWRQAKQFEHKITRSCPECRIASDFVCPSAYWVETKEEKDKLLSDYRSALGVKDCKYFKKGEGKCPFGNRCFYKHALPNGDLVDVGQPKRRKVQRSPNEHLINLLDIYLWEYVDHHDNLWNDDITSDESDLSDWSEDYNAL